MLEKKLFLQIKNRIIMATTKSKQISLTPSVIKDIVSQGSENEDSPSLSEWITFVMDSSKIDKNIPIGRTFRTQHPQIALVYEGKGVFDINFNDYPLEKGALVTLPIGTLFSVKSRSDDMKMHILDFNIPFTLKSEFFIYNMGIIELGTKDYKRIQTFFLLLNESLQELGKRKKSINCIILAMLYDINSITAETSKNMLLHHSKKEILYYEFISSLIREQKTLNRTVSHYAELLGVSADYLSSAAKEVSGFSALEWINRVTIDVSKVLLQEKELTISELAEKMGFGEQTSFSRFFKKETGMTPMEYRNSQTM